MNSFPCVDLLVLNVACFVQCRPFPTRVVWLLLKVVIFDGVQKLLLIFSLSNIFHWAVFNWFGISRDACVWHVLLWIIDGCWYGHVHSRSPCIGRLFCCVKLYNFWPGDHGARPANTTVTPCGHSIENEKSIIMSYDKRLLFRLYKKIF